MSEKIDSHAALKSGKDTLLAEARALEALAAALDGAMAAPFSAACGIMQATQGRVIVTGMGKSGHVARKIAATLASTGRPAMFVHPGEASHGDLGMIMESDCVIAISRSGDVVELTDILHHCRRLKIPLIGMTFKAKSMLGEASDVVLLLPDCGEASEAAPAPTTSTTMCMALGDALAVALLNAAGFTAQDFRAIHPGGKLGAMLKHVRDVMRTGADLPLVAPDAPIGEALKAMGLKRLGSVGVVDHGKFVGMITDGDLRRRLADKTIGDTAGAVMTANPKVISPDASLADAMALLNQFEINVLFVVEHGAPIGVIHLQDLLHEGVR
ncbi:MAG: KpsF/GutQ family sugar-phosphate isomerase [Caulobacterales bacterium]